MAEPGSYRKTPRNAAQRYRIRASYDFGTIHSIVNSTSILHVSFLPPDGSETPFPVTLPMIGHMGSFSNQTSSEDEPLDLYIHGHSSARLMRLPDSPEAEPQGVPVCVTATKFDGIVLALTPFNNSCNYRSAVVFGYATTVTDDDEKLYAMKLITNGLVPGQWENSRTPPTKQEWQTTTILKITVDSASAKTRTGGPGDNRKDAEDDELTSRVWTGVIPTTEILGSPIAGDKNKVKKLPTYLDGWMKERNTTEEKYAVQAAKAVKSELQIDTRPNRDDECSF